MASEVNQLRHELRSRGSDKKAASLAWFFKTGPGGYAEGDKFIGVPVPELRRLARKYRNLDLVSIEKLLRSPIHEERLAALFILADKFKRADEPTRTKIHQLYLKKTRFVNNWDLVDSSAAQLVGDYLIKQDRSPLVKLAKSSSLWERRIAIIATYSYIQQGDPVWTLKIAGILLTDKHDLIHKAVGWMLREVGKRCSREVEEQFLKEHYKIMPRTMLRYAIEHFEPAHRQAYLQGRI